MEQWLFAVGVILLPAVCTMAGAALVFLLRRPAGPVLGQMLPGFAAGIMLAAGVWSLLLPAMERAQGGPVPGWAVAALGLCLGAAALLKTEKAAGRFLAADRGDRRLLLAIVLHNLPEGMVAGLAAALALREGRMAYGGALALSIGIGLQNIPEGAAVSFPLRQRGQSCGRAFWKGTASGLVEPAGALLALALAGSVTAALPWLMSMAAGCMLCVVIQELLPEAAEGEGDWGSISAVLGFALMMAMDTAL